jgi:hypothetical protein
MTKKQRREKFWLAVGYTVALAVLVLMMASAFSGCTTQRKVEKWNDKHPVKSAKYCTSRFPPIEWTRERVDTLLDTITITQPLYVFDTLYVEGDTVVLKTKCPPSQTITKTVTKEKEIRGKG